MSALISDPLSDQIGGVCGVCDQFRCSCYFNTLNNITLNHVTLNNVTLTASIYTAGSLSMREKQRKTNRVERGFLSICG